MYATDIMKVARAHMRYITFYFFKARITMEDITCANLKKHLSDLCALYGLGLLYNNCEACYQSGYFRPEIPYSELILEAMKKLNGEIRPVILPLVETFSVPDVIL